MAWDDRFKREDGLFLWDRQTGEGAKAYASFCIYRDMGRNRSIDASYRAEKGHSEGSKRKAPRRWLTWSSANSWIERAQQYDLYLELLARQERETKHLRDLEQYRERQRKVAAATTDAALKLLHKASERLESISQRDIPPGALPAFFRAAAAVAEAGAGSEAQALAMDELLRLLSPDNDDDSGNQGG